MSAADGVVIYAQNWKHLLKNAAITALTVILSVTAVTLVAFLLYGKLCGLSGKFRELFGKSGAENPEAEYGARR